MNKRAFLKKSAIILCILAVSFGMFIGGMLLTERYKKTIVTTYDKYNEKYRSQATSYVNKVYEEIHRNIELASQSTD